MDEQFYNQVIEYADGIVWATNCVAEEYNLEDAIALQIINAAVKAIEVDTLNAIKESFDPYRNIPSIGTAMLQVSRTLERISERRRHEADR